LIGWLVSRFPVQELAILPTAALPQSDTGIGSVIPVAYA